MKARPKPSPLTGTSRCVRTGIAFLIPQVGQAVSAVCRL